jgi:hypothetical protein
MWYKLLYYLRMFRATSYIVRSFIKTVHDMFSFLFMYLIAVLAFSQAFYVVSNYHEKYIEGTSDGETYYTNYLHSWTASWQIMLASAGDLEVTASPLSMIIHVAFLTVIYLSLLNMLIARVCSSYQEVEDT